eukprot:symbB.v1.2.018597.t2/scaffold1489.1/size143467/5
METNEAAMETNEAAPPDAAPADVVVEEAPPDAPPASVVVEEVPPEEATKEVVVNEEDGAISKAETEGAINADPSVHAIPRKTFFVDEELLEDVERKTWMQRMMDWGSSGVMYLPKSVDISNKRVNVVYCILEVIVLALTIWYFVRPEQYSASLKPDSQVIFCGNRCEPLPETMDNMTNEGAAASYCTQTSTYSSGGASYGPFECLHRCGHSSSSTASYCLQPSQLLRISGEEAFVPSYYRLNDMMLPSSGSCSSGYTLQGSVCVKENDYFVPGIEKLSVSFSHQFVVYPIYNSMSFSDRAPPLKAHSGAYHSQGWDVGMLSILFSPGGSELKRFLPGQGISLTIEEMLSAAYVEGVDSISLETLDANGLPSRLTGLGLEPREVFADVTLYEVMSMSTCAHKPTGVHPDATDPSTSRTPGLSKECWSNAFSTLDRDGDGVITANDLNGQSRSKGAMLQNFTRQELRAGVALAAQWFPEQASRLIIHASLIMELVMQNDFNDADLDKVPTPPDPLSKMKKTVPFGSTSDGSDSNATVVAECFEGVFKVALNSVTLMFGILGVTTPSESFVSELVQAKSALIHRIVSVLQDGHADSDAAIALKVWQVFDILHEEGIFSAILEHTLQNLSWWKASAIIVRVAATVAAWYASGTTLLLLQLGLAVPNAAELIEGLKEVHDDCELPDISLPIPVTIDIWTTSSNICELHHTMETEPKEVTVEWSGPIACLSVHVDRRWAKQQEEQTVGQSGIRVVHMNGIQVKFRQMGSFYFLEEQALLRNITVALLWVQFPVLICYWFCMLFLGMLSSIYSAVLHQEVNVAEGLKGFSVRLLTYSSAFMNLRGKSLNLKSDGITKKCVAERLSKICDNLEVEDSVLEHVGHVIFHSLKSFKKDNAPNTDVVTCQEFCAACSTNEPLQLGTLVKIFDKDRKQGCLESFFLDKKLGEVRRAAMAESDAAEPEEEADDSEESHAAHSRVVQAYRDVQFMLKDLGRIEQLALKTAQDLDVNPSTLGLVGTSNHPGVAAPAGSVLPKLKRSVSEDSIGEEASAEKRDPRDIER